MRCGHSNDPKDIIRAAPFSARRRMLLLIFIMVWLCLLVMGGMTFVLYRHAIATQRAILQVSVKSQARLIEAMARQYMATHSIADDGVSPERLLESILAQVIDAHQRYKGFGTTGEFTLARRNGDRLEFLFRHQSDEVDESLDITFSSVLAEPMQQALKGHSGTLIGYDYSGQKVLAAYEPIAMLGLGIVEKIDVSELRAPFIQATRVGGLAALIFITLGITIFFQIGNPVVTRLEDYAHTLEKEIEKHKRTEQLLKSSERKLRLIIENSPVGICTLSKEGQFLSANTAYEKLLGYSEDELKAYSFFQVMHPADSPQTASFFQHLAHTEGYGLKMEKHTIRKDGQPIDVAIHAVALCDNDEEYELGIAFVEDITDRKASDDKLAKHFGQLKQLVSDRERQLDTRVTEAELLNNALLNVMDDLQTSNRQLAATTRNLIATNKELDAFSYSVSHDLRAPLRHIDGFMRLLVNREKGALDATSARYLDTIAQSSQRMGQLIDNLLSFSRTGRQTMTMTAIDTRAVIREVIAGLSYLTTDRRIEWDIAPFPTVTADSGLLRQVWENLISNAIKYTKNCDVAQISIGIQDDSDANHADEITFFIRDNGAGFDSRYTHKLFGVFQRLHRNDEFEGTGIGLAIVRRIIQRHGGRVWAESEEGKGAAFYFTLHKIKEHGHADKTNPVS